MIFRYVEVRIEPEVFILNDWAGSEKEMRTSFGDDEFESNWGRALHEPNTHEVWEGVEDEHGLPFNQHFFSYH